jgi:hypothetical protein
MFIQLNVLRQRDTSRSEGFLPFQGLTGTLKMGTESVPEVSENLHILTKNISLKSITAEASRLITMLLLTKKLSLLLNYLKSELKSTVHGLVTGHDKTSAPARNNFVITLSKLSWLLGNKAPLQVHSSASSYYWPEIECVLQKRYTVFPGP